MSNKKTKSTKAARADLPCGSFERDIEKQPGQVVDEDGNCRTFGGAPKALCNGNTTAAEE